MLCPTKSDGSYGHLAGVNLAKKAGKARFRRPNQLNSDEHRDKAILGAALGAQAVRRMMGFRLHDVQVRGAFATASGAIIEMQTGEGKTMACALAAMIRSVFDISVHVATTNAYLAERDHETVKPIVDLIRASSKFIGPESDPRTIRNAYRCDITYAPGYPFGFDYLKDQIKLREFEELTLGRDVLESIHGHNIENQMDLDNEAVSVDASVVFNDTEGDTLSFNATGLPPGLMINSTTGEISGMLDTSASAGGPYAVVVTADDGADTVTDTFTWAVDNPATEAADDVFNTDEDTPVFDSVAPNDSDPDTDSVTYAPATSPSNGSIVFNNDGTFTYTPKRRSVAANSNPLNLL